jgi:hypothetical protein
MFMSSRVLTATFAEIPSHYNPLLSFVSVCASRHARWPGASRNGAGRCNRERRCAKGESLQGGLRKSIIELPPTWRLPGR